MLDAHCLVTLTTFYTSAVEGACIKFQANFCDIEVWPYTKNRVVISIIIVGISIIHS